MEARNLINLVVVLAVVLVLRVVRNQYKRQRIEGDPRHPKIQKKRKIKVHKIKIKKLLRKKVKRKKLKMRMVALAPAAVVLAALKKKRSLKRNLFLKRVVKRSEKRRRKMAAVLALQVAHLAVQMDSAPAQAAVAALHQRRKFAEIENKSIYWVSVEDLNRTITMMKITL